MKRTTRRAAVAAASLGFAVFQGCPVGLLQGLMSECFGEGTISSGEYDDLNVFEQLLYEENDCGRYESRSIDLGDLL